MLCCRNQVKKTTDFTRIQKLVLQISKEHKDKIRDDVLFGTGRDAGKTEFLKLIRMQYCVEICKMFESLEDELRLRKIDQPHLADDTIFELFTHPALGQWAAACCAAKAAGSASPKVARWIRLAPASYDHLTARGAGRAACDTGVAVGALCGVLEPGWSVHELGCCSLGLCV